MNEDITHRTTLTHRKYSILKIETPIYIHICITMCFQIKTLKVHSKSKKLARITKNRNIDFFVHSFSSLMNLNRISKSWQPKKNSGWARVKIGFRYFLCRLRWGSFSVIIPWGLFFPPAKFFLNELKQGHLKSYASKPKTRIRPFNTIIIGTFMN